MRYAWRTLFLREALMTDSDLDAEAILRATRATQFTGTPNPLPAPTQSAPSHHNTHTVQETPLDFTRLFATLYNSLDTQVGLADSKAQLIMGVNAILLAAVSTNLEAMRRIVGGIYSGYDVAAVVVTMLMLLAVFTSVLTALASTRPNLAPPTDAHNLFFFDHIARMDEAEYTARFLALTMDDIRRDVAHQIHARSRVIARKYRGLRVSLSFLFVALMLFVIARLLVSLGG